MTLQSIPLRIKDDLQRRFVIKEFSFIGGGCINHGGKLTATTGEFFLKWNDATRFPHMFETEAMGLKLLSAPKCIRIPEVNSFNEVGDHQYIVLEFITTEKSNKKYWEDLGSQLAELHRSSNDNYGLDHDNYIGSLPQRNTPAKSWIEFFISERLEFQIDIARSNHLISSTLKKNFESLFKKLPDLLGEEKPSLIHGDLWSGNLMCDEKGNPCLIDPAVYYGHREIELAFTTLFGGFDERFYKSYRESWPLEPGFPERFDVYNLYPLMVHANLFGGGYLQSVQAIITKYC